MAKPVVNEGSNLLSMKQFVEEANKMRVVYIFVAKEEVSESDQSVLEFM